jgi:predicted O-linked N-acetylglucosamine transferase (SPINDLY family)
MNLHDALMLAVQHQTAGRLAEAETIYRRILAAVPNAPDPLHLLGVLAVQTGRVRDGESLIRQAIAADPRVPHYYNSLGLALGAQYRSEEAIAAFQQATRLAPNLAEPIGNLGMALMHLGRLEESIRQFRAALAMQPGNPDLHNNIATSLMLQGFISESLASYRQAIALRPQASMLQSNLCYAMHFDPAISPDEIAMEHRLWDTAHARPLRNTIRAHANSRDPDRPLRIGYFSPDMREHPVIKFFLPLIENHDRSNFKVFCFPDAANPDKITDRIRAASDGWRDITTVRDQQAAEMIRQDQIDIFVDLAGHTSGNRLALFARKPAPVQVTWLGYPDTTGLSTIDHRFTDAYADPPGATEKWHTETLVRLPDTAWCYSPLDNNDPIAPGPLQRGRPVTFGSFNNISKLSDATLKLWARLLCVVPDSRLILKGKSLSDPVARKRILDILLSNSVAGDRIDLRGFEQSHASHMSLFSEMDIALDPFPYHGTTTTCDTLWMGVPVITLAGKTHVMRVGVSLLNNVGLSDLVAENEEQFVQIAAKIAGDRARLAALRSTLRPTMCDSVLMNAPRFARNVENAFREMWRTWCSKNA